MQIEVYSTFVPDVPLERHDWAGCTFAGFLDHLGLPWRETQDSARCVVTVNGKRLDVDNWDDELPADAVVRVNVLPGGGLFKSLGNIIGLIFNAVFGWLLPSSSSPSSRSPAQGQRLEVTQAKANSARLGEVVPELAGRFRRFPDYLTPPRRYFASPREQWLVFHACIGPGVYHIEPSDVRVGDTPFSALGDDGTYELFPPGADVSGTETHEHWHTVEEVGGTSSGTAGLELSTEISNRVNTQPPSYQFDGAEISRESGEFPIGWGNGTLVSVQYPQTYNVETIYLPVEQYNISEITGWFGHVELTPNATLALGPIGNVVLYRVVYVQQLTGGVYTIRLFTDALENSQPVVFPEDPAATMIFGADIERQIATMSAQSITLGGVLQFDEGSVADAVVEFAGGAVFGEWGSEFVVVPGNETTDLIEVDFFMPNGLAYIDGSDLESQGVSVEIEVRNTETDVRLTFARSYVAATLDQIGYTERISIPRMRPAVRVRRVTAESTRNEVRDIVHWFGLKSQLATRTSYPRWTTMSVKLRSGGRLAAQSENQINVIATRVLPTLHPDGTWGAPVATRDISAFFRYIAGTLGYTDAEIDRDELVRLHAIWAARGETMDHVFEQTTAKQALNDTLGAGMAELTVSGAGRLRSVRDEPRTQFEQPYSPQNMTRPLRRAFQSRKEDDHDGVEVEYTDGETWTQQTVICALPGSPRIKLEKIKLIGVTDRTRAWRIGMRRAREIRYRRWEYQFGTELDALNSEYMSYVPLFDDIPGYGQSALLVDISQHADGALLRASEPLRWEEGASHIVGYRRPDGTLAGPWPAAPGPDDFSVIADIPAPWPVVTLKQELPHVFFGKAEHWCFPALITDIKPSGMESVAVTGTNYAPEVYADDDNTPD